MKQKKTGISVLISYKIGFKQRVSGAKRIISSRYVCKQRAKEET